MDGWMDGLGGLTVDLQRLPAAWRFLGLDFRPEPRNQKYTAAGIPLIDCSRRAQLAFPLAKSYKSVAKR